MRRGNPGLNGQLVKILMLLAMLGVLFVMKDRCASGVDNLFRAVETAPTAARDGGAAVRRD